MDTNNWRSTPPNGEPTMETGDWRTQLQPLSRQRIVNKIMDTLKRHLPFSGLEGLNELRKIAVRFEEKIFTAASSQPDYLRRILLKMHTMETKSQNTIPNTGNNSNPPDLDSTAQTGHANGGDWQEEVYQKEQLGPQSNISGLQQQQQQQLIGTQSGNSSMQTNQQSLHMLPQPKVPLQQTQQSAPNLLPTQGQTSQQPQQQQQQPQQLVLQMQSQSTQLQQQLGLQQQSNQLQQNMQQRLQASGQASSSLLQSQNFIDQQKQLYQSPRAAPETSSASLDSIAQTGRANGDDWQEEVYQKIKAMKETYLPELNEMYLKIAAKLQQHDSLPQQPKSEQLEKLKIFKTMLERIITFLSVSKANISPALKDKLSSYEKQIINFIKANISALQQGQLPPPRMFSMQQPQLQINQTESHDSQMNPQLQSINLQGSVPTMQSNNMTSLQHNSLSSLPGVSTAQQTMLNLRQPGSNLDSDEQ